MNRRAEAQAVGLNMVEAHATDPMKLLLAEDDVILADALAANLQASGFEVEVAGNGAVAEYLLLRHEFDIGVLDLGLPLVDGLTVLKRVRQSRPALPMLVLTALDGLEHRVAGLNAGADDYLTKPFRFEELLARLRALTRRGGGGGAHPDALHFGPITVDRLKHRALVNGARLDLTPKEFHLLEYFLLHADQVVRRTTLLEKVWDMNFDPESNVVDVHLGNLRRKLAAATGDRLLQTVRGVGFALRYSECAEVSTATQ